MVRTVDRDGWRHVKRLLLVLFGAVLMSGCDHHHATDKTPPMVTLEITGAGPPLTVSQNPASRRIGQPDVVEITANGEDDDGAMKSVSLAGDYSATCVGDSSGLAQTKTGDLYAENPAGTPSRGRTSHAMAVKLSVDIARLSTCSAGYSFRALRGTVTARGENVAGGKNESASFSFDHLVLRVATFNISHGYYDGEPNAFTDDPAALSRWITFIDSVDVVFLQDVDRNASRSGGIDEARVLSEKSALGYYQFQPRCRLGFLGLGGEYGIAVLSRFPLNDVRNHDVPATGTTSPLPVCGGQEPVVILEAVIEFGGERHHLFGTHYNHRGDQEALRIESSRLATALIGLASGPVVFAGDLNAEPSTDEIKLLTQSLNDSYVSADARLSCESETCIPAASDCCTARIDDILFREAAYSPLTWRTVVNTDPTDHAFNAVELALR